MEAVGPDFLVDDPGLDADVRCGLDGERDAAGGAPAVIDVLVYPAAFTQRVDEAAISGVVADRADRGDALDDRNVDGALQVPAEIVAVDQVYIAFDQPLDLVKVRLVGDVANRDADRARAEQCSLRAAQRLDAVEIEQVEIGCEQRERDHRFRSEEHTSELQSLMRLSYAVFC